jgi:hypothetical protein
VLLPSLEGKLLGTSFVRLCSKIMGKVEDAFYEWMKCNGAFLHSDLDFFATLPGGDRGVVARAAMPEGELLVRVPLDLCIYTPGDPTHDGQV